MCLQFYIEEIMKIVPQFFGRFFFLQIVEPLPILYSLETSCDVLFTPNLLLTCCQQTKITFQPSVAPVSTFSRCVPDIKIKMS